MILIRRIVLSLIWLSAFVRTGGAEDARAERNSTALR